MVVTSLPIAELLLHPMARPRMREHVLSLKKSIEEVGLLNPILVRQKDSFYEVVAGGHRLEAYDDLARDHDAKEARKRRKGEQPGNPWATIPCHLFTSDELHAQMAMLDENLRRTGLSPAQMIMLNKKRKELYEALHPKSKPGLKRVRGMHAALGRSTMAKPIQSYAEYAAAEDNIKLRTSQQRNRLSDQLSVEVLELITGTRLDNKEAMRRLLFVDPEDRLKVARETLENYQPSRRANPITNAYLSANKRQQREFLDELQAGLLP